MDAHIADWGRGLPFRRRHNVWMLGSDAHLFDLHRFETFAITRKVLVSNEAQFHFLRAVCACFTAEYFILSVVAICAFGEIENRYSHQFTNIDRRHAPSSFSFRNSNTLSSEI